MIEIKSVSKSYNGKKMVLKNISFKIESGEIFAFIGHNGAGKTTMIKSIMGILDFEEGDILINGRSIKEEPIECKKIMAYVPDNPDLYENMKAIDYINFVCDMYDTSLEIRKENTLKYAKMFEIEDKLNDDISSFSHGMKQKIALIAALSHNPEILIMDEQHYQFADFFRIYYRKKCNHLGILVIELPLLSLKVLDHVGEYI